MSRTDFFVWVCTYLSTTVGDLGWGICIGILMAAMGFIVNNQRIKGQLVVQSTKEDLLMPGVKIEIHVCEDLLMSVAKLNSLYVRIC